MIAAPSNGFLPTVPHNLSKRINVNSQEVDKKLDEITLRQAVWKNSKLLASCLTIAQKAIETPIFWPDELTFDFLLTDKDRNIIGSSWRLCAKTLGIIEKTGLFKRSKGDSTNGRIIFQYRLIDRSIAMAFLKRHDVKKCVDIAHPQFALGI